MLLEDLKIENEGLKQELNQQEQKDKASWAMHLAIVKARIKQPKKNKKVTVKLKNGGSYEYKYATLSDVDKAVMDAIRNTEEDGKPLLTYYFDVKNDQQGVQAETIIVDATTGYSERTNRIWFRNLNIGKAQDTSALISYAKRYSLSGAFGIASDDDDDAQHVPDQSENEIVDFAGLQIIWNAYIKQHDQNAKQWLFHDKHNQATLRAIKQKLGSYKYNKNKQDKTEKKPRPIKKSKPKSENEAIKEIVDGKKDPNAAKAVNKPLTSGQQDLFNDILGG